MAPGHVWVSITTSSYFRRAPNPDRPTTSAAYFAALVVPGANNCSCALSIGLCRPDPFGSGRSEPAMCAIPLNRSSDAVVQPDLRRISDVAPRAADVEGAALGEEVHA